jgi:hypothetical protein
MAWKGKRNDSTKLAGAYVTELEEKLLYEAVSSRTIKLGSAMNWKECAVAYRRIPPIIC